MNHFANKGRSKLLLSVGTAMVATMMATGAQAAETVVVPNGAPPPLAAGTVTAHDVINSVQQKILSTDAPLTLTTISVDTTDVDDTNDPTDATAVQVDTNSTIATGTANTFTSTINLGVVPTDDELGAGDGAAALGVQLSLGTVSSTVDENEIAALLQDFSSGTVAVTNNTIGANATGNSGTTLLQGAVLPAYASDTAGYSQLAFGTPADWLDATGGLVASTLQIEADDEGAFTDTATASSNAILLSVQNTAEDATMTATPVLGNNTIAATVAGNSSKSTIDVQGGAATFTGTAVVTNAQINLAREPGSSIAAVNQDSAIIATVAADDVNTEADAQLQGSLTVSGNAITSSASGNQALGTTQDEAGNRILLADGASFVGANTGDPGAQIAYDAGNVTATTAADLVVQNSQGNAGTDVTSSTGGAEIAAVVDDIDGGSVAVRDNQIASTVRGNIASSAFASGDNMASFTGSVAVANQQSDYHSNVLAEATGDIHADVTGSAGNELPNSTVGVAGNQVAANAYGNSASQSLSLDAAVQNLPLSGVFLSGGTAPDGNMTSQGSATVTNVQSVYDSNVNAREVHNIYANVGAADSSSVKVTGSPDQATAEAVALGNSGSNTLTLSGVSVGGGAGIASMQTVDGADDAGDAAAVSASSTGIVQLNAGGEDNSSSAELSGNLQRGIAYGNSVSNTLGIDAQTITVDGSIDGIASSVVYDQDAALGLALDNSVQPSVSAAYATLNVQSLNGNVAAEALPSDDTGLNSSFALTVGGAVTDSGLVNNGNALVAAAYGNDAANTSGMNVGNLDTSNEDFASVLNLTNVQTVTPASNVSAHAGGSAAVLTSVGDHVDGANISTSSNTVQALAYANLASNQQTVTGTNIDTEADSFPFGTRGRSTASGLSGDETQTDASFSVNNVQYAGGSIGSSLVTDGDPGTSASIVTTVGSDVTNSTIVSNGNTLSSGATGNRANNLSSVGGNGLATTNALANMQFVGGETNITSTIGIQGSPASPGTDDAPFDYTYDLILSGTVVGEDYSGVTGEDRVLKSSLSDDQVNYLLANGWNDGWNADTDYISRSTVETVNPTLTGEEYSGLNGTAHDDGATIPGVSPSAGTPNSSGVTIAIGGAIDPSTVSVNGNTVSGSVTGNSATNAVALTGTEVADGSDHLGTWAIGDSGDRSVTALGDAMLSNMQVTDVDTNLTSNVYNTFAIDTADDATIAGVTLTVDGNVQSSRAVANTADNSVTLTATNTAAGAALVSFQDGRANVDAISDVDIFAPVASTGSSISMSGNTNVAVGVENDATNTLTVDTGSATYVSFANQALADVDTDGDVGAVTVGDHVLLNQQRAPDGDPVSATAATRIYNDDLADPDTVGITNGTVTVTGNSTLAEASANRAINTANVSAGSSLAASAAVTNVQTSEAFVTSSATTSAGVTVAGNSDEAGAALNAGSATVGGNTTTALARGNQATNVLNYAGSAGYGTAGAFPAASSIALGGSADAYALGRAAVLNVQDNNGPVTATSTDATYMVALNNTGAPAIANGTVGVIGNSVSAAAYGNNAVNTLTVTSGNTGMPTATIGNYQNNTGAVLASVTTVNYGINAGVGAVTGSALSVTGNSVTATAIGNSAVSTIGAAH